MRICIVEDEPIVAWGLRAELEQNGFPVDKILYRAEDAVSYLLFTPPDVILMDVLLQSGEHTGITIAQLLRNRNIHTPIVFTSGQGVSDVYHSIKRIDNVLDFLEKPVMIDKLLPILENLRNSLEIEKNKKASPLG